MANAQHKVYKTAHDLIEHKIKLLRELKAEQELINTKFDQIKKEIIKYIGDSEELRDKEEHLLLTYKNQVRECFNKKLFEEEHPRIARKYVTTQEVRVFLLK
jgi:hypothetical protein